MKTITQIKLSKAIGLSPSRLSRLKNGRLHASDLNMAKALGELFNTDPLIWIKGGDQVARRAAVEKLKVGHEV